MQEFLHGIDSYSTGLEGNTKFVMMEKLNRQFLACKLPLVGAALFGSKDKREPAIQMVYRVVER